MAARSRRVFAAERDVTVGSIPAPLGSCPNERGERQIWLELLLARQLTRSTVLSAQISTLDTSADLPSAYFPRRST